MKLRTRMDTSVADEEYIDEEAYFNAGNTVCICCLVFRAIIR